MHYMRMQECWRFHRQIDRNCGVLLALIVVTEGDLFIWMVGCWRVKWHGLIGFPSPPAVMLASVLGLYGEVQLSPIRACSFFVTQSGLMGPHNTIRQRACEIRSRLTLWASHWSYISFISQNTIISTTSLFRGLALLSLTALFAIQQQF